MRLAIAVSAFLAEQPRELAVVRRQTAFFPLIERGVTGQRVERVRVDDERPGGVADEDGARSLAFAVPS